MLLVYHKWEHMWIQLITLIYPTQPDHLNTLHTFLLPTKKTTETSNKKNIKKNERTYRDGIPKKQPNKVGMVPQYPYGLSSLYLLPFFKPQHTRTQTNPCHATPAISTANRMCMAIAALYNATHITPSHYNLSSTCSNTHS